MILSGIIGLIVGALIVSGLPILIDWLMWRKWNRNMKNFR